MRFSAVTGLYDIGRQSADGRPIDRYVAWLNETLRLPIPFTIFLDPTIPDSAVRPKQGDSIVRMRFEELAAWPWLSQVELVCAKLAKLAAEPDLTFRLPAYAILLHSKFEWLEMAHRMRPNDDGLLWIDAGISRFFGQPGRARHLNVRLMKRMLESGRPVLVDAGRDFARMQRRGKKTAAGTSLPITHGGTFFVNAPFAPQLRADVFAHVENWLAQDLWDNEQVVLGEMALQGNSLMHVRQRTGLMGAFARSAFPDDEPLHRWSEKLRQVAEHIHHK